MADGMAEWQKEWQNGRMAGMATYVLFMVHTNTDTDTDTTLIFYITEGRVRDIIQCPTQACTTPHPGCFHRHCCSHDL
jgi:hypothetical protein